MADRPAARLFQLDSLRTPICLLLMAGLVWIVYAQGLSGGFVFDDYPNIVDNALVQPDHASPSELIAAALSSPSSELKRPLSSLTFAVNFLVSGLDAVAMKITNVVIHALNGFLLFFVSRRLLARTWPASRLAIDTSAAMLALGWLMLPINLTAVLYVVQRMESLANLFVLLGLLGYLRGRDRMLEGRGGLLAALWPPLVCTAIGVLAKETAVMLPLYALLLEMLVYRFARRDGTGVDRRLLAFHGVVVVLPLVMGLAWLLPAVLQPRAWLTRDFTLGTRLLSEMRILVDYIVWTVAPTPSSLSFYHDEFVPSQGLFQPVTTALSLLALLGLAGVAVVLRHRRPLTSLGIAWYLGCHALTGTILPLELVYEHRNYFASIGVLLVLADTLRRWPRVMAWPATGLLLAWWTAMTAMTAYAWDDSLRLAQELGRRGPDSPRAQYELGRAYIIHSRYDTSSPYTAQVYPPLERAATLPGASILPEQAMIFMNSRIDRPVKEAWWTSIETKLRARPLSVQDESSLDALSRCLADDACHFPTEPLRRAFEAGLEHPAPTARFLAIYAAFAQRSLHDDALAMTLERRAVGVAPSEPAYRISLARMAIARHDEALAREQIEALVALNIGGRLDSDIATLKASAARGASTSR
ncbi:hypothetical protein KCV01_g6345, partial [Aureobasidium melanogenum]